MQTVLILRRKNEKVKYPPRELTYPNPKALWEDEFPFPLVGYVSSLQGNLLLNIFQNLPGIGKFFLWVFWAPQRFPLHQEFLAGDWHVSRY